LDFNPTHSVSIKTIQLSERKKEDTINLLYSCIQGFDDAWSKIIKGNKNKFQKNFKFPHVHHSAQ
jgi:hypothetical protein